MIDSGLSKNYCKELINKTQRYLQSFSIKYIQKCALGINMECGVPFSLSLINDTKKAIAQTEGSRGKRSVSCFVGMIVLLALLFEKKREIVLKVTSFCYKGIHASKIYFTRKNMNSFFSCTSSLPKQSAVYAIEGVQYYGSFDEYKNDARASSACNEKCTEIIEQLAGLKKIDIIDCILANAASHPQFPGDEVGKRKPLKLDHLPFLKNSFDCYKNLSQNEGMDRENMRSFLITHIYPDYLL